MNYYLNSQLTDERMLSTIYHGLEKTTVPKKIIIVGAGISGLVTASLLKDAGHDVEIIEASEKVGGRIKTIRTPFINNQYIDVGAMRIPNIHHLTLAYINKFQLPVNLFINSTPNDLLYFNGIKARLKTYEQNPDVLNFPVAANERGKTAKELADMALQPLVNFIYQDPQKNWPIAVKEFGKYSLDTFFRHNPIGPIFSPGAIDKIIVVLGVEGISELSVLEILREYMILINPDIYFYEITGGTDRLPKAFLPQLRGDIHYKQKMTEIVQHENKVTIHSVHTDTQKSFKATGDLAIITIPFSVLQFVDIKPYHSFSYYKRKAIRQLNYIASTKIGLQFKNRFWENEEMYGGNTTSDIPTRFTYYPSTSFGHSSGVVLASYTWGDDALIWNSLSKEERVLQALKNLATIHGNHIYHDFITGVAYSWFQDPYAGGAFALFKPEKETDLMPYLFSPERRVHFAGEHTALPHGWIQGAIESGIRAAHEVNHLPRTHFY